jgi:hypothetical protein
VLLAVVIFALDKDGFLLAYWLAMSRAQRAIAPVNDFDIIQSSCVAA